MVSIPLSSGGDALEVAADITFVDVGNPHCVIPVANPDTVALEASVGPLIERHPLFRRRVNVEFISVLPDGAVRMRARGAGEETQACGTGATAVGCRCRAAGMAADPVVVRLNGVRRRSRWPATGHVIMTGPATEVFTGVVADELKAGWAGCSHRCNDERGR